MSEDIEIAPVSNWGRQPLYQAKIGTTASTLVMIKRARKFRIGQCIQFAELDDVRGMCVGCTPAWRHGSIWRIDDNRLFIER